MERDDRGSFLRKNGRDEFPDMIQVRHLTKNYGNGKGIYDISFEVGKGEIFGLVGPKGAGKTTVMRAVMGFLHPGYGTIKVSGKDGIQNPEFVQRIAGYPAGKGGTSGGDDRDAVSAHDGENAFHAECGESNAAVPAFFPFSQRFGFRRCPGADGSG